MSAARRLPRPFSLHRGGGNVVEEATIAGRFHEPALQLLEFEDGSLEVRFCYLDHQGRFQRSPLMLGEDEIEGLRRELSKVPWLQRLIRKLVR